MIATTVLDRPGRGVPKHIVDVCRADAPTRCRRIYPRAVLEAQIVALQDVMDNRGWVGELGVPEGTAISFKNASHLVTDLWMEGDMLRAEVEILNTPSGRILQSMLDAGVVVPFHLSGIGNGRVDGNGVLVVGDSYKLIQIIADADRGAPFPPVAGTRYRTIDDQWEISERG